MARCFGLSDFQVPKQVPIQNRGFRLRNFPEKVTWLTNANRAELRSDPKMKVVRSQKIAKKIELEPISTLFYDNRSKKLDRFITAETCSTIKNCPAFGKFVILM